MASPLWWEVGPMGLLACMLPTLPFCSQKLPAEPPCLSQPSCFYPLHCDEWVRSGNEWAGSRVCSSVLSTGLQWVQTSWTKTVFVCVCGFFVLFFVGLVVVVCLFYLFTIYCWVRILLPGKIGRLWNAATHCTVSLLLTLVSASLCASQAGCLWSSIYTLTLHCYHFCWGHDEC